MSEKSEKDNKAFQSYLDNIKAKTGKTPEDFRSLAAKKGLTKNGEIVAWLKADFELGHGHANAIAHVIMSHDAAPVSQDDAIAAHFAGKKADWRKPYDALAAKVTKFGSDVEIAPRQDLHQFGAWGQEVWHCAIDRRAHGHWHQAERCVADQATGSRWHVERNGHASRARWRCQAN